jgi:hypothetical protein
MYFTFLLMMLVYHTITAYRNISNSGEGSILIRGLFRYSSNYLETKKLLKLLKSELQQILENSYPSDTDIADLRYKIKYVLMRYNSKLPKLDLQNDEEIEINTDELNLFVSFNKGQTFHLIASSDVNLKNYYSEYLQTGLGRSAKNEFLKKTVEKITKLLN